jgi:hypothetical protein
LPCTVAQRWICALRARLLEVQRDALLHVGQREDLVDVVVAAVLDQLHHQRVVADANSRKRPRPVRASIR